MSPAEAIQAIGMLQAAWPRAPFTDDSVRFWAQELLPFRFEDVEAGIHDLARRLRFPPSLAEVIEAVIDARVERQLTAGRPEFAPVEDGPELDFATWLETDATPEERERAKRIPLLRVLSEASTEDTP